MKRSSNSNPQKNSPLFNLVFVIVLLLTALPFVLFALLQFAPPSFASSKTLTAADTTPKRLTAAERRAAREEARKATEATTVPARSAGPVITTTTVTMGPGMGPGMDFGPGAFGGPGMGPGMDFGPGGPVCLTLEGRTPLGVNPVLVRFGDATAQECPFTGDGPAAQTFELNAPAGECAVAFLFLPGC